MNLNVDFLIEFFRKNSIVKKKEMDEQEAAGASTGGGGTSGGKAPPKWEDIYNLKKGKANPKTAGGPEWVTGMIRGVGNQIW